MRRDEPDPLLLRLRRSDGRIRSEWTGHLDPDDGDRMDDALIGAVKADAGDDWRRALPRYVMEWRRNRSERWQDWRAAR